MYILSLKMKLIWRGYNRMNGDKWYLEKDYFSV